MERFLSQCAKYIYSKHANSLRDVCLVFPNRRSGVFFTSYLQKEIKQPVIGPGIITVNEFISSYSDWHTADKLQLISILFDVFSRHTKTTETFDEFYFWGEILLADFNDIDRYMVNAKDLFTNISDLKEIESVFDYLTEEQKKALEQFWGSMAVADKGSFREKYLSIWDKLYPVYKDFKEELQKQQLAFPGMIDRDVAEKVGEGVFEFPAEQYYVIGLNALNTCEIRVFESLQKSGKVQFLWDYDSAYVEDERNEAGYFLRNNLKRFLPPDDFVLDTEVFKNRKSIELVAVSSVFGQSQQIPEFIRRTEKNYRPEFDNTAIVLADESLLFSALGAIPEEIDKINITMGYPVRNSVMYGFMMLLVNLLKNKRREENGFAAYHRFVTDILNHQLLAGLAEEESKKFVLGIKQQNRISVSLNEINFSPIHQLLFDLPGETSEYSAYFLQVLGLFYQQQKALETPDQMLMELIYAMYQAIEKLDAVVKKLVENQQRTISETVYFRLFSQYLGQVSVSFEGEPLSGLQVMGILETRCLDFENLIILGLNENKWPRKFTAPSFIPHNIRFGFGLPGIDEQDAMYAYYFYRLIQRANNVTATYSVVKEGINTGELSRYGYQLQYDSVHKPVMQNLEFRFSNDPVQPINITSSAEIVERLLARNAEKPLSPSAINTYLSCSLKFYFHYVANLPEPEEIKEEIDGAIFGNIFHDTMETLYKPFVKKLVQKNDIENIAKHELNLTNEITRQIAIHYLKMKEPFQKKVLLEGKTLLFFENIKTYIQQVLKIDKEHAPFEVLSLEEKYSRTIKLQDKTVKIEGKIDRLDRKDRITRVLDYKTGGVKSLSFKEIPELFVRDEKDPKKEILQAMIYSWGVSKEEHFRPVRPAIYTLRNLFDAKFDPFIKRNNDVFDFAAVEEDFEAELSGLVSEIFSGENVFSQTQFADKCRYCPYKGICRRF